MATYTITHKQVQDNVATVQVLQQPDFEVGQSITISGLTGFNGTYVITEIGRAHV